MTEDNFIHLVFSKTRREEPEFQVFITLWFLTQFNNNIQEFLSVKSRPCKTALWNRQVSQLNTIRLWSIFDCSRWAPASNVCTLSKMYVVFLKPSSDQIQTFVWLNFFLKAFCDISRRQCGITSLSVFFDAFPGHKMLVHLLTAPGILVIWAVTHPSTNRAQRCLTSEIKRVPVCPAWHNAVSFTKKILTLPMYPSSTSQ
jgi:hypothetical protein